MSKSPGRKDIVPHTPSHPHASPSSMLHHTLQHHLHGIQPVSPSAHSLHSHSPSSSMHHLQSGPSIHHLPSPSMEKESFSLPHSLPVFTAQSSAHIVHQQQHGGHSNTSPESSSDDLSLSTSRSGKDPKIAIIAENLRQKQQKQLHDMLHKGNTTVGPSSDERKAFRDTVRDFDRQKLWVGILYFAKSATAFQCLMDDHPILRLSLRYRFPWCSRKLLHILKNKRLRLSFLRSFAARPTPFELRADPILALFSDDHLLFASSCMRPVVFLAHEAVIFSGLQESHCYFIRKGSVDLRLGCETIATVFSGSLFGVMEMLSAEKRATEVIARETVFCWKLAEESFSAYPLREKDKMYHSAYSAICEQRQVNLRRTHFGLFDPSFLQEFHGLRKWSKEALRRSMQRASPHVFRKGEVMICHSTERETDHCALFVMHGTVKFLLDHSKVDNNSRMLNGRSLAEMLALVCGLQPRKPKMASFLDHSGSGTDPLVAVDKEFDDLFLNLAGEFDRRALETKQEIGPDGNSFTVVGELAGPMVLNAATLILNEATPFLIKASSMCDTMKFYPQEEVVEIAQEDREQLKRIRHEMLQVEGRFLPPLGRQELCYAIVPKQICFSFLTKSFPYEAIPFVPIVMDYGHKCIFTASNDNSLSVGGSVDQQQDIFVTEGDLCLVLLSGKLEELSVGQSTGRRLSFRSLKRSPGNRRVSMDTEEPSTASGTAVRRVSYLWPDLPRAFFGVTSPLIAIATEKTVALQCRRADLLDAFAEHLNHNDLKTFVDAVVTSHRIATGQTPSYTDCGSQLTDAKIHRVTKNRRNSYDVDLNTAAGVMSNASAAKAMLAQNLGIGGLEEDGTPQRRESLTSAMSQLRFSMNSPQNNQKLSFRGAPLDPSAAHAPTGPERGRYFRTHLLLSPRRESAAQSPSPQPDEPTLAANDGHDDLFEEIAVVAEADDCGDLEVLSVGDDDENVCGLAAYRFGENS